VAGASLTDQTKQIIQQLFSGIAARVDGDLALREQLEQAIEAEHARYAAARAERSQRYHSENDSLQAEFDGICGDAGFQYQAHYSAASEEYDEALRAIRSEFDRASDAARQEFDETRWMVTSYFDENAGSSPKIQFEQFEQNLENTGQHLDHALSDLSALEATTIELLQRRRMWTAPEMPLPNRPEGTTEVLLERFNTLTETAHGLAAQIRRRQLPRMFAGFLPILLFLILTAGLTAAGYAVVDPAWLKLRETPPLPEWLGMLGLAAMLIAGTVEGILFGVSRSSSETQWLSLAQTLADLRAVQQQWLRLMQRELKRRRKEFDDWFGHLVEERDSRLQKAQERFERLMSESTKSRNEGIEQAHSRYPALLESITSQRDERLQVAQGEYPGRLEKLKARYEWDMSRLEKEHSASLDTLNQQFEFNWQNMARTWLGTVDSVRTSSDRMLATVAPLSQAWPDLAFGNWAPAKKIPRGIRLGTFALRLQDIEYGLPEDDRLLPEQTEYLLPAMVPFPDQASLLIRAPGAPARQAAVNLLQVAMLRLLTTLPPGKVRFTILDPIGLGENFSAFMHLADYDELMVTSRIWTEASHIDQRLVDLTEHMETVFQTYLRNEFGTIEEYNEHAGEVAEPYRILVIAGFPANFSEQAGRRLTSILSSGPRCGVYTLMSVDPQLTMPPHFSLKDAEHHATCMTWRDGVFQFDDQELGWLPLETTIGPEPDEFSRIVKRVGDESKDARRVEVSFERVMPRELWTQDSRSGLDVPLGRAGATKLQHLRLGRGTSQHVLVAGKTGSGKSTLMHILVTNLALHYSPDEVEFFLIDFKKGVEFKTYATNRLPHARVIAIESDREFGLSVLERLDEILKERGDQFRECGAQDIAGYRAQRPQERAPRLLLLIDEFQEFFTEDDRISQQAALLLDRLVRQGRAFGIHVLLGSQTLGGAYSLARSTLGQVAVRIALQCSEADAHLILSEENSAARLLTRPGEAIYNDANGMLEGNHPFQIAWLEDNRRDECLGRIRDLTREQGLELPPPIVFEGNIPADAGNNQELARLLKHPATGLPRVVDAWLGEAVAIKPHTAIRFRRLAGSNLLIVGQNPTGARGILATVVLAAAAQIPPVMPAHAMMLAEPDEPNAGDEDDASTDHASRSGTSPDDATAGRPASEPADPRQPSGDAGTSDAIAALKSFSFASMKLPRPGEGGTDVSGGGTGGLSTGPHNPASVDAAHSCAQFCILDGELADAPDHEYWQDLADRLPHESRVAGPNDAARVIADLHAALRHRTGAAPEPPIFLVIDNVGRFRDLRKSDDDFSFSGDRGKAVSPARQFVDLLREGPSVGIHTLIWADTFNNASRWMSSQTMRELELRVAFQMSATDSSNLIDSPAAGRLGQNRALLYLEETGTLEKFRPYGLPESSLLDRIAPAVGLIPAVVVDDDDWDDNDSNDESDLEPHAAGPDSSPDHPTEVCDDLSSWTIL